MSLFLYLRSESFFWRQIMSSHLFWSEVALSVFSLFVKLRNKFKFQKRTKDRRVADAFLHLFHKNNKQAEPVLSKSDYVWILCEHCRQASPSECLSRSCSFAMSMSYHNHIFPFRVDIRGYVTLWLNDKHSVGQDETTPINRYKHVVYSNHYSSCSGEYILTLYSKQTSRPSIRSVQTHMFCFTCPQLCHCRIRLLSDSMRGMVNSDIFTQSPIPIRNQFS